MQCASISKKVLRKLHRKTTAVFGRAAWNTNWAREMQRFYFKPGGKHKNRKDLEGQSNQQT
jgi:hypothetical protein